MSEIPILIPAYGPGKELVGVVAALSAQTSMPIVVVDDGSGPQFKEVFDTVAALPRVTVLPHAVNLGKGAALKTGINHILCIFPECLGVVTADADGQHHPEDILRIVERLREHPDSLILGVRRFHSQVPLRSRFGNVMTRSLLRAIVGQRISDTQTGLRGIPRSMLAHLLKLTSSGYEFELDMLIACKHQRRGIYEEPIRTIYVEKNRTSHFNPLTDSMRIYFVLLRFSTLSAATALVDNAVFISVFRLAGSIAWAQIAGRLVALTLNYLGARGAVFHSQQKHLQVLPKYLMLVGANAVISYSLISFLHEVFQTPVISAKLIAEGTLFVANFAIQRDFVFTRKKPAPAVTDWEQYYRSVPATARLTRKYTSAVLLRAMRRCGAGPQRNPFVIEIGGANSCFLDRIMQELRPEAYHVIDNNEFGLELLRQRTAGNAAVALHQQNILAMNMEPRADIVFSVGLVEHFAPAATKQAILAHFDALKQGGHAIITFPTPTLPYRVARFLLEAAGLWKFHDERPLRREEVIGTVLERGEVVYEKVLWPLILSQRLVVARKW